MRFYLVAILAFLGLSKSLNGQALPGYKSISLTRNDLNTAIPGHDLFVEVRTTGTNRERIVCVIVLHKEKIQHEEQLFTKQLVRQVKPVQYRWYRDGEWWLAGFFQNRDNTYHTLVGTTEEKLKATVLSLLILDIEGDGKRENILINIDFSAFDLTADVEWRRQSLR